MGVYEQRSNQPILTVHKGKEIKMGQALTAQKPNELQNFALSIDSIINDCLPITQEQKNDFYSAFQLANGIKNLRQIFNSPQIQELIEAMKGSPLGFLTDEGGYRNISYNYNQIKEACIEALLQGYRLTGNEFNIISGRFYPAKNGKYRKIVENKNVTDFNYTTTTATIEAETRYDKIGKPIIMQFAKVQCFASWNQGGQAVKLGDSKDSEDKCVFKIRVNQGMMDDAIIGKALSKLFSRVLTRIENKVTSETDLGDSSMIIEGVTVSPISDSQSTGSPLQERLKNNAQSKPVQKPRVVQSQPAQKQERPKIVITKTMKEFDQLKETATDTQLAEFRDLTSNLDISELETEEEQMEMLATLQAVLFGG